jgi:RimJ/RimL family protein N-acetyltransferase
VERRSDGAFLGTCGLSREPWYPDDLEVGWRLHPEVWGQGYATEAGHAWIGYAFDRLGAERVISVADVPNRRSRAVMERLGMRLDHQAWLTEGEDRFEAVVCVVTRADWGQ